MEQNTITVKPNGGLGNRIRVILSALNLAKKRKSKLVVLWKIDAGLNCCFEDIFCQNNDFQVINSKYSLWDKLIKRLSKIINLEKLIHSTFKGKIHISEKELYEKLDKGYDIESFEKYFDEMPSNKSLFVECCWSFYPELSKAEKYFIPKQNIARKINDFSKNFNNHTVGIHIRGTDNLQARENSSLELFLQKIKTLLAKEDKTNFFLATDDLETQNTLIQLFPNKFFIYSRNKTRNSKQGIEEAVIDIFLLSKTKKIYGSYWSTFSMVAAKLGGIELEIIKNPEKILKDIY